MSDQPGSDAPSFSRPVHVSDVPGMGRNFNIITTPEERALVARQLGLPGIAELTAKLLVRPFRKDGLAVEGTILARLTQTCVVSNDDFESTLEAPVEIRFSTDGRDPNVEFDPAELIDPNAVEPPDLLVGGEIDLGAVVTEFLALSLDPYPRKPGAAFSSDTDESALSPFAALKTLKNKNE